MEKDIPDTVLELTNGVKIVSNGEDYITGAWVQVLNKDGNEIGYWQCNEWEEDAELVMGAILRCALYGMSMSNEVELQLELPRL